MGSDGAVGAMEIVMVQNCAVLYSVGMGCTLFLPCLAYLQRIITIDIGGIF